VAKLAEKILERSSREIKTQQTDPIIGSDVDVLMDSKIVIAGAKESDVAFMKTMLEISGFSNITATFNGNGVMECLRQGIQGDNCDIDLLIIDSNLPGLTVSELRIVMDDFDEWRLIPIISLTQESEWDHAQILTDLGHSVTSLFYHPLTAESFPPSVMTALAVKKERDEISRHQVYLQDELDKLKVMEARLQFSVAMMI